jgi:hypothetical protein
MGLVDAVVEHIVWGFHYVYTALRSLFVETPKEDLTVLGGDQGLTYIFTGVDETSFFTFATDTAAFVEPSTTSVLTNLPTESLFAEMLERTVEDRVPDIFALTLSDETIIRLDPTDICVVHKHE